MKSIVYKYLGLVGFIGLTLNASAQVTTEPPEYDDPQAELKIIVDISRLDASIEHNQLLQDAAADGEALYIWTWSPAEHPATHPLVNGTGAQPWKNSNDSLRMTKEAESIYSFTMRPTDFYEVDAQTVYENDISFLVKPKDGGGYGDPDRKSIDFTIAVDPPSTERSPAFLFPGRFVDDDLVMLYYDNKLETEANMQELGPDECFMFGSATLSDSSTVSLAPSPFQVNAGSYPNLQMSTDGDGVFKAYFSPRELFQVPSGLSISSINMYIMKPGRIARIGYDVSANLTCE
jgi:hypothetical protein